MSGCLNARQLSSALGAFAVMMAIVSDGSAQAPRPKTAGAAKAAVQWSPHRENGQAQGGASVAPAERAATAQEPDLIEATHQAQPIGTGVQPAKQGVRPAKYAVRPAAHTSTRSPYVAQHLRTRPSPVVGRMHMPHVSHAQPEEIQSGPGVVIEGSETLGEPYIESAYAGNHFASDCACGGIGCNLCGGIRGMRAHGPIGCDPCQPFFCLPQPNFNNLEVFAGTHGFTGPANRGSTGSFGFHEGLNWGTPLVCGLAFQAGVQVSHSNFSGSVLTPEDRTQTFTTLGGFRRVDWGLQGGLVVDYLSDDWDYNTDLVQLRGELGWRFECNHEVGFWFAAGTDRSGDEAAVGEPDDDTITVDMQNVSFQATDLFAFFYRRQFACGGEGRVFGGFSGESHGVFGSDFRLPINACVALESDFIYLSARERDDGRDFLDESWNVSISLVWTPYSSRGCQPCGPNYCRPLFDVANNGSFIPFMR